jgi:hypothetical protein
MHLAHRDYLGSAPEAGNVVATIRKSCPPLFVIARNGSDEAISQQDSKYQNPIFKQTLQNVRIKVQNDRATVNKKLKCKKQRCEEGYKLFLSFAF